MEGAQYPASSTEPPGLDLPAGEERIYHWQGEETHLPTAPAPRKREEMANECAKLHDKILQTARMEEDGLEYIHCPLIDFKRFFELYTHIHLYNNMEATVSATNPTPNQLLEFAASVPSGQSSLPSQHPLLPPLTVAPSELTPAKRSRGRPPKNKAQVLGPTQGLDQRLAAASAAVSGRPFPPVPTYDEPVAGAQPQPTTAVSTSITPDLLQPPAGQPAALQALTDFQNEKYLSFWQMGYEAAFRPAFEEGRRAAAPIAYAVHLNGLRDIRPRLETVKGYVKFGMGRHADGYKASKKKYATTARNLDPASIAKSANSALRVGQTIAGIGKALALAQSSATQTSTPTPIIGQPTTNQGASALFSQPSISAPTIGQILGNQSMTPAPGNNNSVLAAPNASLTTPTENPGSTSNTTTAVFVPLPTTTSNNNSQGSQLTNAPNNPTRNVTPAQTQSQTLSECTSTQNPPAEPPLTPSQQRLQALRNALVELDIISTGMDNLIARTERASNTTLPIDFDSLMRIAFEGEDSFEAELMKVVGADPIGKAKVRHEMKKLLGKSVMKEHGQGMQAAQAALDESDVSLGQEVESVQNGQGLLGAQTVQGHQTFQAG
ncbi:uncharacterized protein CTHT_0019430 [Thermochaetoides thermophila DSM 1495]|uniref:Uncharacterized protein n=1 Tax=Chaetomium thermophilum (strain DSM 1495 / CBS 144.50 / IMI 039719) TaxID=759272 RepID=G0S327_CHATD|nr:hypothetical protein CTHT_0019430 [Thermochaetoides thermophila DSM 1495]EGS22410.1 hypothetical protein CTHT_0019430 [Thermochaetoides thermophila DSM 1495]